MAHGRITDASIAAVRETARLDRVISDYVTLKKAGPGSMKGLCPFHDEKSPSFHVTPDRGFFTCFGCGEGGDAITFMQKIENLDFVDAIERLADRFGVTLQYEETANRAGTPDRAQTRVVRARLVAANAAAADYYAAQLLTPEAADARRFLSERGFDRNAAADFTCGYAPNTWDALIKHLTGLGFTEEEIATAGLSSEGKAKGPIDRFRARLMFPIRDTGGDIIGFGGRKLLSDDQDKSPKYLNTPETPIYKKSRVLFGLDKARKAISKDRRVVVVEGYTDVMACHLSGEMTAVATCGTAFGEDHIRIIRRLLSDDGSGGEVIYTFDGDAAGRKAALKAFTMDEHFQTRTSVAVEPSGMDPCELRIAKGPDGIRALLDERVPLFEFALKATLSEHNLRTVEGRTNALVATAPILANIKHPEMRDGYIWKLSRWTGTAPESVREATRSALVSTGGHGTNAPGTAPTSAQASTSTQADLAQPEDPFTRPGPNDAPHIRDALKVMLQNPKQIQLGTTELRRSDFTHPTYKAVWDAITAAYEASPTSDGHEWVQAVLTRAASPTVSALITELAVEPHTATSSMNYETALSVFLRVAQEAGARRAAHYERALAAPDLSDADMVALMNNITSAHHRYQSATERLNQILLGTLL